MKRILLTLLIMCFATTAYAGQSASAITSGEQTSDAIIFTGGARLTAVHIVTDGTNDAKLIIHDNTAKSGKVVCEITVSGGSHYGGRVYFPPIEMDIGISADIAGTGASYFIEYARN